MSNAEPLTRRVHSLVERIDDSTRGTYAEANELELVFDETGYPVSTAETARAERQRLTEQFTPIKEAFADHDVSFVVIKDPYLPKPISDIDILVADPSGAHTALTDIGFAVEDDTEPHRETYTKSVAGQRVAVDLHLALSWRRVPYLSTEEILQDSHQRTIDGYAMPCPSIEHHLAITAAHSMFKHNELSMFEVLETTYLFETHTPDTAELHSLAASHNWQPQLAYFLDQVTTVDGLLQNGWQGTEMAIERFPIYYRPSRVVWFRGRKLGSDLASGRLQQGGVMGISYSLDIVQHIIEQRGGISMKPFFDKISWAKRRLDR